MTFMARLLGLLKADIHGVLDTIEDKALLLSQYCREMEDSLQEKAMELTRLAECCHSIKAEISAREEEREKLEKDLRLALSKDKESIARLLIRKLVLHRNYCEKMRHQRDVILEEKNQLSNLVDEQRLRYDIIKVKVNNYRHNNREVSKAPFETSSSQESWLDSVHENEIDLELIRWKEQLNTGVST